MFKNKKWLGSYKTTFRESVYQDRFWVEKGKKCIIVYTVSPKSLYTPTFFR